LESGPAVDYVTITSEHSAVDAISNQHQVVLALRNRHVLIVNPRDNIDYMVPIVGVAVFWCSNHCIDPNLWKQEENMLELFIKTENKKNKKKNNFL